MRAAEFEFDLPEELIAQHPAPSRDASRLLVFHRSSGRLEHRQFPDVLQFLRAGDVLVLNNSRVIPARLRAMNPQTRGAFEILLLEENARNDWWAMMRPAKRARLGSQILLTNPLGEPTEVTATVIDTNEEGHRRMHFTAASGASDFDISTKLDALGELPLPPYIKRAPHSRDAEDRDRYQTVFACDRGSIAAPTAGLHFTECLLRKIDALGVDVCHVTLHVGPGTFAPVKAELIEDHAMHHERFHVTEEVADKINTAKSAGRRVVAVGTTSVRVLESVARTNEGRIAPGPGRTNIFIHPPYLFRVVDALLTNFHLPRSTLLMLASAFAAPGELTGREKLLTTYEEAVRSRYRFFSYGDAMLML